MLLHNYNECSFRYACFKDIEDSIEENGGGLDNFTKAYKYYGINIQPDNTIICREWAPGAKQLFLAGDFSKYITYVKIQLIR